MGQSPGDGTAQAKPGPSGDHFFLKNGGFFNAHTVLKTKFTRKVEGGMPKIDFDKLP